MRWLNYKVVNSLILVQQFPNSCSAGSLVVLRGLTTSHRRSKISNGTPSQTQFCFVVMQAPFRDVNQIIVAHENTARCFEPINDELTKKNGVLSLLASTSVILHHNPERLTYQRTCANESSVLIHIMPTSTLRYRMQNQ